MRNIIRLLSHLCTGFSEYWGFTTTSSIMTRYRFNSIFRVAALHVRVITTALVILVCMLGGWYVYGLQFTPRYIVAKCEGAQYRLVCYNDNINTVLIHRGLAAAFDVLAAAYTADAGFAGSCHGNTHDLGKAAYEEYHRTGTIELTQKASYCSYGFYHGFMEALLAQTRDLDEARSFCSFVGRQVPVPAGSSEGACYHGIGHGVTDGTTPSEWGNAIAIAAPGLTLCSQVAQTDELQRRCYSGVFNSLAILYKDPKYKLDPRNDPFGVCASRTYSTLEKEACYGEMNTLAVYMGHQDLATALAYTRTITDSHYRSIAISSAADYYVRVSQSGVAHLPVSDLLICRTMGAQFEGDCVAGLMDGIWEFGSPGIQYQQALKLCGAETLTVSLATACFARVQSSAVALYAPTVIPKICALVPDRFKVPPCSQNTGS